VVKWETIRLIVGILAHLSSYIKHLDVQTAFIYGILSNHSYLIQPQGFAILEKTHLVCHLACVLCKLYPSHCMWYTCIKTHMLQLGLYQSLVDANLYFYIIFPYGFSSFLR
jgi:hypothetical protein